MGSTTRARLLAMCLAVAAACGTALPAAAQSPVIALRTNASIARPGDCLRLEALALEDVPGPLAVQVTYRYPAPLVVKDEDGTEKATTRTAELRRQPGPVIDGLSRLQLYLLDDTFCFGQGGAAGAYSVVVALRPGASGSPFATLRTCVLFEDPDAPPAAAGPGCGFSVRGLKSAEGGDFLVFDADLPSGAFYRGAILRGGTVEAVLDAGIVQTGSHELSVLMPAFDRAAGGVVDLVLVDQFGMASATIPRLLLSRAR